MKNEDWNNQEDEESSIDKRHGAGPTRRKGQNFLRKRKIMNVLQEQDNMEEEHLETKKQITEKMVAETENSAKSGK